MADTKQKFTELLIQQTLEEIEQSVAKQLSDTHTSFIAKLDGLKVSLNSRIDDISTIIEQKPFKVNFGTVESPKLEMTHKQFKTVIDILKSQKRNPKNIMLVGEAGSGKTHLACNVADALGLKFYPMSVGLQTTKSDLLGFINAHGQYVTSPLREAFEKGGVLLLDEFDTAHAGVVTIINSLLANGHCSFPDKIVEKHDNFICLVACNTYGHGANVDYVGRNKLDGATLDRFITVHVGYDEQLEENLTGNKQWIDIIKKIRENIAKQGIKMIISPRASMNGADLLDAGFKIEDVLDMVVFKGADLDTRTKVMEGIDITKYKPDLSFDEVKDTTTTQKAEPITEGKYKRDLSKYQTYKIQTEEENIETITKITPLNDITDSNMSKHFDAYILRFGAGWVHQYTAHDEIFFSSKPYGYYFKEREIPVLVDFFNYLDNCDKSKLKEFDGHIAFEFIKKGCRNPHKVITLG